MADWLLIILIIMTIYRLTRFVIADTWPPIDVPRTWLINWWDPDAEWIEKRALRDKVSLPHWGALGRALRYLFTCPWCMSVWVGGGLIWSLDEWWRPIPAPLLVWATASAVTGLLSGLEDKLS